MQYSSCFVGSIASCLIDFSFYYQHCDEKDWKEIFEGVSCSVFVKKENAKEKYLEPVYIKDYYRLTMFRNKGDFTK